MSITTVVLPLSAEMMRRCFFLFRPTNAECNNCVRLDGGVLARERSWDKRLCASAAISSGIFERDFSTEAMNGKMGTHKGAVEFPTQVH